MGSGTLAVIHSEPRVPWQPKRAAYFAEGFKRAGIPYRITDSRTRLDEGFPVLLGTSLWRCVEASGPFLLVDRCSFGDTEKFVSLVWNGHGRRGDHRLPMIAGDRWERIGSPLQPWRTGSRVVLCGQTEAYSPHYTTMREWYATVKEATHFKSHPAGTNPTGLPDVRDFENCRCAAVLNSSVGVQCVLEGVPTVTYDEGCMAWDVTGHSLDDIRKPDRMEWARWLAWTQHSDDEIRDGELWKTRW